MLSKIVVKIYAALLEIGLWLILLIGLLAGWEAKGALGAIGGAIAAALFGAVFLGAFLVLNDIRNRVTAIESATNPVSNQSLAQAVTAAPEAPEAPTISVAEKDQVIKGQGKQCRQCGEIYAESYIRCPNCK